MSTGHNKTAFNAAALDALDDPYEAAMAALARGQPRIPREEWLKAQKCHNCGEMAHLSRDCPNKKQSSFPTARSYERRGGRKGNDRRGRGNDRSGNYSRGRGNDSRGQRDRYKKDLKKAFLTAVDAMDDNSSDDDATSLAANVAERGNDSDSDESNSDSDLQARAARVYSSLKE